MSLLLHQSPQCPPNEGYEPEGQRPAASQNFQETLHGPKYNSFHAGAQVLVLLLLPCIAYAQTVSITSPTSGSVVSSNIVLAVSLSAVPTVHRIEYWMDGELHGLASRNGCDGLGSRGTGNTPFSCVFPSAWLPDMQHSLYAIAKDGAGATLATSSTITFRAINAGGNFQNVGLSGTLSGAVPLTFNSTYTGAPYSLNPVCGLDGELEPFNPFPAPGVGFPTGYASSAISVVNDTITVPGHGLWTGQMLSFRSAGTCTTPPTITGVGALSSCSAFSAGPELYAIVVDHSTFKFATSFANAIADTAADITSAGDTGFTVLASGGRFFGERSYGVSSVFHLATWRLLNGVHRVRCYVRPSSTNLTSKTVSFPASAVNTTTGNVTLTNHPIKTGRSVTLSTNGTLPTGLTAGTWYGIRVDDDTFKLAASAGGSAVIPSDQGSGTHSITLTIDHPGYVFGSGEIYPVNWISDITVNNTATNIVELHPAYFMIHCAIGGTASLAPRLKRADGSFTSVSASAVYYRSMSQATAAVDSGGIVSCVAPGTTRIISYYGDLTAVTYVRVSQTANTFLHVANDASGVLSTYDSAKSFMIRSAVGMDFYCRVIQSTLPGRYDCVKEARRAGFNTWQMGLPSTLTGAASLASCISTWSNTSNSDYLLQQANRSAAPEFRVFSTGDNWTNNLNLIQNNVGWDRQACAKRVLDDMNLIGGILVLVPADEINGRFGASCCPNPNVGGGKFVSIVVSGCASTPCAGTGTVNWANSYAEGLTTVGTPVWIEGATNAALNRPYQVQAVLSGGVFTVKTIDAVNGTYDATSDPGMKFHNFGSYYNCGTSLTSGISISVSGNMATATKTSHGLAVGQPVNIKGATTDTDLNNAWVVASVPDTNTFTFDVRAVAAGTYDATSDAGMTVSGCFQTLYRDTDMANYRNTTLMQSNPDPLFSGETVGGTNSDWMRPPFSSMVSFNASQLNDSGWHFHTYKETLNRRLLGMLNSGPDPSLVWGLTVSVTGPGYYKYPGIGKGTCWFEPGTDAIESVVAAEPENGPAAIIMSALSAGFASIKLYFQGDRRGGNECNAGPSAPVNTQDQPGFAGAGSVVSVVLAHGAHRAFRLARRFEPCFLNTHLSSPYLGPMVATGLMQCAGGGRLLQVTNFSEQPWAGDIDVSGYKFGRTNQVYRLTARSIQVAALADAATWTGTIATGETVLIFFPSVASEESLRTMTIGYSGSPASAAVLVNYVYGEERGAQLTTCGSASCSITVDSQLTGALWYQLRKFDIAGLVIGESTWIKDCEACT